ncbi:MAG TPA: DegT/DnrJ/EryC1/StrS family aminotransferase [Candidatus Paceibacterota bacterium]|nr:DegT/DnrJ/EryC1/StrS family aminotransferase [Candidatus Paceibacterota bacterium]
MNVPFLDLTWQHAQIAPAITNRFNRVFENAAFTLGEDVKTFEDNFARYIGIQHVVGVDNGTDALAIAYHALGLRAGDEIITIPTTFIATISPAIQAGIKPVFVDIDPATRTFDFGKLEAALTPRTKAIVPVHLAGDMPNMDKVTAFATAHNLMVIEDAAQAHGARFKGARAGSFGLLSTFSFYPGKNLGAYGQAGAIATNDPEMDSRLRKLRSHGEQKKYQHEMIGWNSRLDTLQAIVLDEKLKKLDEWNAMRVGIAKRYDEALADLPLGLPPRNENVDHVYHLYVVELKKGDRDDFIAQLAAQGISTGIHYPLPVHLIAPVSAVLGTHGGDYPAAESYCSRIVSLPLFPGMSQTQIDSVIASTRTYFHA